MTDPFGTAALRSAVLQAWDASPTRFREDANAEGDLRLGGYRDRVFVELVQNAADAAAEAGKPGSVWVRLVDGELRVANTGAPLTAAGVESLASLRASAKREGASVGRFGVGFSAVLSVSEAPSIVSSTGGVHFSASGTRAEASGRTGPADELARREGDVPVLRLVWPTDGQPPEGYDSEVRLPLRPEVDAAELLTACAEQAGDLLLALPSVVEIRVDDRVWRTEDLGGDVLAVHGPDGTRRWLVHRAAGKLPESTVSGLAVEEQRHSQWWVCWAVQLDEDGTPIDASGDVLHAPTPTDERVSLPARLLAGVPLEPDRRRVANSRASETVLVFAAECYPELVSKVDSEYRASLVPVPDFPLSDVDEKLRQVVTDRLRVSAWLPSATGRAVAPHAARVLDFPSAELVELLADLVPGLVIAELSEARFRQRLAALEVTRLGTAEIVETVTGVQRPASWWYRLYAAVAPIEESDPRARDDLAALPVPLADGRTVTGPRDVLLGADGDDPGALLSTLDISGLRIVAAGANHPLLEKLGAHRAGPGELLDAPPLAEAVRRSVADARAGSDTGPLVEAVLRLASGVASHDWLGALALPDFEGEHRRADESMLPDAALRAVLDTEFIGGDGPLSVLDAEFAARWPRDLLTSIGVLDGFAVHVEEDPVEAPKEFADGEQWWHEQETCEQWPPSRISGVRDLDLVAAQAWPAALRLLVSDPDTLRVLREPGGHASWWIARFATLAGHPPRFWRLQEADELAGLYDPVPDVGLDLEPLRLAGVRQKLRVADTDDAADLLARLAERERTVRAGTAVRAHRALADAVACDVVETEDLEPPRAVRSLSGAVVDAHRAVVLDEPWLLGVLEAPLVVAGGSPDQLDAEALAELLDLPLASEDPPARVPDGGTIQQWSDTARVSAACELLGVPVPPGTVAVHETLTVRVADGERRVHWWVDTDGAVHADHTPDGLGRALAWATGHWPDRFALTALLADPEATTLLR